MTTEAYTEELEEWQELLDDSDDEGDEEQFVPVKTEYNETDVHIPDHFESNAEISGSKIPRADQPDDEELEEWQKFLDESDDEEEEEIVPMKVESNSSVACLPDRCASGPHTSQVSFIESAHGRLRRRQRGIDKKDLQAAKKYGKKGVHRFKGASQRFIKYAYKDITYIVDQDGKEVTSWAESLSLSPVHTTQGMEQANATALTSTSNPTSYTVLVVDASG